jgi:3-hydroxybutyryl-CoA dehydrogenase
VNGGKAPPEVVGVVGAGVIGVGVAESLAATGHDVVLVDVSEERLADARRRLRDSIRTARLLGRHLGPSIDDVLARVKPTVSYDGLADTSFVIENVSERWEVKKHVYAQLDVTCPPHCVLAANTSAIPIRQIAASTSRADRVVGLHFMNPVARIDAVELIRPPETSVETLARAERLLGRMGKHAIVVQDGPGFVSNRILMVTINEAILTVERGVAPPADVDRVFRECFGHPMGPLETADLIGLDTVLDTLHVLRELTADERFTPSLLLRQMVDAGSTGKKTGRGFFVYD